MKTNTILQSTLEELYFFKWKIDNIFFIGPILILFPFIFFKILVQSILEENRNASSGKFEKSN